MVIYSTNALIQNMMDHGTQIKIWEMTAKHKFPFVASYFVKTWLQPGVKILQEMRRNQASPNRFVRMWTGAQQRAINRIYTD